MKNVKIKSSKNQLKVIKKSFIEEKKRFCGKNKQLIKNESKTLYHFFLEQEKDMEKTYEDKMGKKESELRRFSELEGKELFEQFNLEEKINNISLNNKSKKLGTNLSTNDNSI